MSEERLDILLGLKMKVEGVESALGNIVALKDKIVALAVASAPAVLIRQNGELASQLKAVAGQTGLTTDALQTLKYNLAEDAVQVDTLTQAVITLRKNLQNARTDPGSAIAEQFRTLRLDAAGLQALKPEQQLEVIGQRLNTAVDREAAFNAALDILGSKAAPKVLESLKRLATEGLPAWEEKSKALRLTEEQLETLDRAGNHLQRIWDLTKLLGAKVELGAIAAFKTIAANANPDELGDEAARARIRASLGYGTAEDPMHGRGFTPDSIAAANRQVEIERQMQEAETKAQLEALDRQDRALTQRINAFTQKNLAGAISATIKATTEQNQKLEEQAQRYRELAQPAAAYERQIREVQALVERGKMGIFGGLTEEEGAAAIARLTAEMNQELPNAIDKSNAALRGFGETLNQIDNNPYLTDEQKRQQRVATLRQENEAIAEQIKLLQKFAAEHPGVDPAAVRGQIRGLGDRATENNRKIGEFDPASAGFQANILQGVTGLMNQIRPPAQALAKTITDTIGGAFDQVGVHAVNALRGLESGRDIVIALGETIEVELIGGLIRMGVQWVEQKVLMALFGQQLQMAQAAATLSITTATAAMIGAAMVGPATLATIATLGSAAVAAPEEIAAAMAATAPMALFYEGGHTGNGGVVHANEWVAPEWMVSHPGFGRVIDGLESVRIGGPGALGNAQFAAASSLAGSGITAATVDAVRSNGAAVAATGPNAGGDHRPRRDVLLVTSDRRAARNALQDPQYRNELRTFMHREYGLG